MTENNNNPKYEKEQIVIYNNSEKFENEENRFLRISSVCYKKIPEGDPTKNPPEEKHYYTGFLSEETFSMGNFPEKTTFSSKIFNAPEGKVRSIDELLCETIKSS